MRQLFGCLCILIVVLSFSFSPRQPAQAAPMIEYRDPAPFSKAVKPTNTIAIRLGPSLTKAAVATVEFQVVGSRSGLHAGDVVLAEDQRTVIFKPASPFVFGETVRVSIKSSDIAELDQQTWSFEVVERLVKQTDQVKQLQTELAAELATQAKAAQPSGSSPVLRTVPFNLPPLTVTLAISNTPGYIFVSPFSWISNVTPNRYLMMVDNTGAPIYYKGLGSGRFSLDFRKIAEDKLVYFDTSTLSYHVMNQQYQELGQYRAGNGYQIDFHEFLMLPNGHVIFMIYDDIPYDLSPYGGEENAILTELVLQELDTAGNVVFQWRSTEHIPVYDSSHSLAGTAPVDYIHGNAIDVDTDGHWLVSSRHTDEITKINRQTGAVIWRLGGEGNQFLYLEDSPRFYHQHDIRRLANGNIMLYNNWNTLPRSPDSFSAALEYEIDEVAKTVRLVKRYRATPDYFATAMGNAQRLPNGNTGIGWGSIQPLYTEFNSQGQAVFELTAAAPMVSYRSMRFEWQGDPPWPPTLVTQSLANTTNLYYSWNGATEVADYQVFTGVTSTTLSLQNTTPKTSFETNTTVVNSDHCFAQVRARNSQGTVLGSSEIAFLASDTCTPNRMYLPALTTQ
ncbi:MAG TPA: hypothetical protein DEF47_09515 [Herpetosiphon sp.]|uniref:SbsA Ig-like domain-containing protein n=1 Tax=Herpetosiphon aurantiacus (strain ATCC 23779 / DSM 785 / 114-95) TaxID=316274 RepID=A9B3V7_HERA2|nr:arylsulfotransferase family protein [Herpetosiphon sp.]ABX06093.1 hypothetical protein Haur_3457 [Herpetosiphon aurantiacus DSM 785]HBW50131.1 hypothetical protein [Herpetosiphon sp.]